MKLIIQKTEYLTGEVLVPASKSQTIRGLILGMLANGQSTLINPLEAEDTKTAEHVCRVLGASIKQAKSRILIKPQRIFESKIRKINTGDSGITTRFILPILGLRKNFEQPILFDCGRQMRARPIGPLVFALNNLGMAIKYKNKKGQCPLVVSGRLIGGKTEIAGITSQYLSALLLALPLAPNNSEITVKNLHERPYINMTLAWLKELGIAYSVKRFKNTEIYKIPGGQKYKKFKKNIPGDFSSASYLLAAACLLGKKVVIKGLHLNDEQGDKKILSILRKMGAKIKITALQITVSRSKSLRGIKIDANDIPDLVPTLAVLATQAKGKTQILNVAQARIKETDRLNSMTEGLRAMGAKIQELSNGLVVHQSRLKGAKVSGFNDHRTVMALSLAGLLATGTTEINTAEAINKTFPSFIKLMQSLGGKISQKK